MSEPITFSLVRQCAASRGVPFADVERGLYGDVPPHPPARKVAALVKNAVAALEGPARVSPLKIAASRAMKTPEVPADVRAEYADFLIERAGRYMDDDPHLSVVEADRLALEELGCVDFFCHMIELEESFAHSSIVVRIPRQKPVPGFCSRCESVGHLVAACPFSVADESARSVAVLRRERRARRERAA